jgi:pimeloyl-ACP methyl ester carboxylesterase
MPVAENHGVRLHWEATGDGTPVLLIMGHRYTSRMWYPILADLAAKHRVVSFDNRGVGQSDTTSKTSIAELVEDSLAVMDAAGVVQAHVFGVSMGGGIALEFALRHPDRVKSLLLGCTCILTADKPRAPAFLRSLYRWAPWLLTWLMRRRGGDHGYGSAAPVDRIALDQKTIAEEKATVAGVAAQSDAVAHYVHTREAVAGLTMPALVLHGDEDALVPFAWGVELAETLPNSRFVRVAGAGHNFFIAGGQRINDAVLEFLDDVDRGAPIKGVGDAP